MCALQSSSQTLQYAEHIVCCENVLYLVKNIGIPTDNIFNVLKSPKEHQEAMRKTYFVRGTNMKKQMMNPISESDFVESVTIQQYNGSIAEV